MDKEVIEKIIEILVKSRQAGENFGAVMVRNHIAKEIDAVYKSLGFRRLDKDQSLPELPREDLIFPTERVFCKQSQQDMLNAGFRKVKK